MKFLNHPIGNVESMVFNSFWYSNEVSPEGNKKRARVSLMPNSILDDLTWDDVKILTRHEDERAIGSITEMLFPTPSSFKYLEYFDPPPSYEDLLLDAWERKYALNRQEGIDLLRDWISNHETEIKKYLNI